jgi:hypothetical protein
MNRLGNRPRESTWKIDLEDYCVAREQTNFLCGFPRGVWFWRRSHALRTHLLVGPALH